jgi:hypothetical protein
VDNSPPPAETIPAQVNATAKPQQPAASTVPFVESSSREFHEDLPDEDCILDEAQQKRLQVEWNAPVFKEEFISDFLEVSGTLYLISEDRKTRKPVDWVQPIRVVLARRSGEHPDWRTHHHSSNSVWAEDLVGQGSAARVARAHDEISERLREPPIGHFRVQVPLDEIELPSGETTRFQIGLCLGEKRGKSVSWTNVTPILTATVKTIALPGRPRLPVPQTKVTFTKAACSRIREHMTRAQVESTLGCPKGDYTTGPWEYGLSEDFAITGSYSAIDRWRDDTGEIIVAFGNWKNEAGDNLVLWTIFRPIVRR